MTVEQATGSVGDEPKSAVAPHDAEAQKEQGRVSRRRGRSLRPGLQGAVGRWIRSPYLRPHRLLAAALGLTLRPSFLIIGAQRAGTTSLYRYLVQHPEVRPALYKEVHYFDLQYHRRTCWYLAHFPTRVAAAGAIAGEASPYYLFYPLVPERVVRDLPGVKLIVLLRNPIDRAYSHYHHEVKNCRERLSFQEAIERERTAMAEFIAAIGGSAEAGYRPRRQSCLSRGLYVEQLRRWMQWVPRHRFLICKSEEFYRTPGATLSRVRQFLDMSDMPSADYVRHNVSQYPALDSGTRRSLNSFFAAYNHQLSDYLGISFDEWK